MRNLQKITSQQRYASYVVIAILITIIFYVALAKPEMTMRIMYTVGQDAQLKNYIVYDMGKGYQNTERVEGKINAADTYVKRYFEVFFQIPDTASNPKGMQIILQPSSDKIDPRIQIKAMEIYNHKISMVKYTPEDLTKLFTLEQIKKLYVEEDRLCLEPDGTKPSMIATPEFMAQYAKCFRTSTAFAYNLIATCLLFSMIAISMDLIVVHVWKKRNQKPLTGIIEKSQFAMRILMILGLLCVLLMALKSQHYAHPDEDVTRLAIDYYLGKWLPPDIRTPAVAGTFSNYGFTRLGELTLYYFLAGKIGWIFAAVFHVSKYYRMLNVLLFAIMVGMFVVKGRKHPWMFLALGITPQLWYLFSYATSDAFDYFCGFLIIYQLVEEDSLLHQYLSERASKPVMNCLVISALFSMLLRGKANYYLILLFTFCVLLIKWITTDRQKKWKLLQKYLLLLCCSFLLMGVRIGVNYIHYGAYNNSAAVGELVEKTAAPSFKPDISPEERLGHSRASIGYSYADVMRKDSKNIIQGLISSGVGSYGWLEYYHSGIYGYAIVCLYGIIYLLIIYTMIRERKKAGILDAIVFTGILSLSYFMVVYQCWSGDFQTQGRYVLPLLLIVAYYSAKCKGLYQNRSYHLLLLLLGLCSLNSYVNVGLGNLVFGVPI